MTDECGRLTRWLRLMGYDTATGSARAPSELYRRAYNESRVIVTRNRRVGASCLVRVIQLTSTARDAQLSQIIRELGLTVEAGRLFTRCDVCNVPVEPLPKVQAKASVPPYVYKTQERFHRCPSCRRIYWAATHWERAHAVFKRITS